MSALCRSLRDTYNRVNDAGEVSAANETKRDGYGPLTFTLSGNTSQLLPLYVFLRRLAPRAGLHDNVPADLLPPRWQKVRQFRATQPRCTDWVATFAVQATVWDSDRFNVKCHGRQLAANKCNLKRDVNAASFRGIQPAIYFHGKALRRSRYQNKTGIWQARC